MANIVTGNSNFIGVDSVGISLINCDSCVVEPRVINLTAINCTSIVFTNADSNCVYIKNAKVGTNKSTTITSSAAYTLTSTYSMHYVDASAGNVVIYFDNPAYYTDMEFCFKRISATANTVSFYSYLYGTELLDFTAMPLATYLTTKGDSIIITTNGTDWFVKSKS